MDDLLLQRLLVFTVENGHWCEEEDKQRPFKTMSFGI
jgi:hypothetical protein